MALNYVPLRGYSQISWYGLCQKLGIRKYLQILVTKDSRLDRT